MLLALLSSGAPAKVELVVFCVVSRPPGGGRSAVSAGLGVLKLGGEVLLGGEHGTVVERSAGSRNRSTCTPVVVCLGCLLGSKSRIQGGGEGGEEVIFTEPLTKVQLHTVCMYIHPI